ncbi:MAG: hypothetical protein GFH27_549297n18 [Chloroflexi bacterium AL-W]|nr:hypothetical protein [Chloroflexi bacterium AL-N1]NOK68544.1 hypothetical protein [Chloroflexi bacterium AL-N10]NOK76030.1 hypothetical protein [Chloroflexi bacterium AL-N5]NOK82501.1 hypothetical protein [Chloroflexi bacterium AL-W]NOK92813.1 hypothetical protein [Chloroflexi bacterium AL-N15]
MSYRQERRRSRRIGCLASLVAIVWVVLLVIIVYQFFLRDAVSQLVGEQITERIQNEVPEPVDVPSEEQIQEGAQEVLPTAIAALPTGEIRITEDQANAYITDQVNIPQPIEAVTIRFLPGQIQAEVQAIGTTSTATMGMAVQNGQLIALDPQIDGILSQFISASDLIQPIEQQINAELASQNRVVTNIQIEQGELVVGVDG